LCDVNLTEFELIITNNERSTGTLDLPRAVVILIPNIQNRTIVLFIIFNQIGLPVVNYILICCTSLLYILNMLNTMYFYFHVLKVELCCLIASTLFLKLLTRV